MLMTVYEENPFIDPVVAREWIASVENEQGGLRDSDIYPRLRAWSDCQQPGLLVEIGAGQGACSRHVIAESYLGIEPSVPLVRRARQINTDPSRQFIVGNAYNLPLGDTVVEAAYSVNVWFHLADLEAAAAELARVLCEGGGFLIITANPALTHVWESFYFDSQKVGKRTLGKVVVPVNHLSRNTFYAHTLEEITRELGASGLFVDAVEPFGDPKGCDDDGLFIQITGSRPS